MSAAAAACRQAMEGVGSGVGASLRAVDCAAGQMAEGAFGRLAGLSPALTILLTLFIAFLGFGMITGRARISLSSLTPRMVVLIGVVTFATSWVAFQSVFYNLAVRAPDWLATLLMATRTSATSVFADKIDVTFMALIDASSGQAMGADTGVFSPPGLMWLGGTLLLLGTVGVLATCKIALAVLMGLGPVFIVMTLFQGTRGLFTGWLKGVVLLAIAPLFAVLGGSLMLELAVPVIAQIGATPGKIDPRAAMAFFMIGAVHAALMIMVLKVAGTMVAGWSVFGLAGGRDGSESPGASTAPRAAQAAAAPAVPMLEPRTASPAPSRQIRLGGAVAAPLAANDAGPAVAGARRETVIATAGSPSAQPHSAVSRARGIGSRFRAPPRPMEKTR